MLKFNESNLPLRPGVSLRFWKMFSKETRKESWEKLFLAFGIRSYQ